MPHLPSLPDVARLPHVNQKSPDVARLLEHHQMPWNGRPRRLDQDASPTAGGARS